MSDRRALLFFGIAVKREELMSLPDPGRRLVDRATRDVDREVIARIGRRRRRLLEAEHRLLQRHLDRAVGAVAHRQP